MNTIEQLSALLERAKAENFAPDLLEGLTVSTIDEAIRRDNLRENVVSIYESTYDVDRHDFSPEDEEVIGKATTYMWEKHDYSSFNEDIAAVIMDFQMDLDK